MILKTQEEISTLTLSTEQLSLLNTLAYFHVFSYPCTAVELLNKSNVKPSLSEIKEELNFLVDAKILIEKEGLYTINEEGAEARILTRKQENCNAAKALIKAERYTKLISKFPFVEGVYLSGSLSKGIFNKEADIDYFIITKPKRLWICRSLLILYKKIFLLNSRKYFCVNYFIDTESLSLTDKNLFVATELIHLIPTYNLSLYRKMMDENGWIKEYFPNFIESDGSYCIPSNNSAIKSQLEKLLFGNFGETLDTFFFKLTLKRWKKKFSHMRYEDFDIQMRSKKNVSKHHPGGHQKIVLEKQQEILHQLITEKNLIVTL